MPKDGRLVQGGVDLWPKIFWHFRAEDEVDVLTFVLSLFEPYSKGTDQSGSEGLTLFLQRRQLLILNRALRRYLQSVIEGLPEYAFRRPGRGDALLLDQVAGVRP